MQSYSFSVKILVNLLLTMVKFLDLQKITDMYSDRILSAMDRVTKKGWFLNGTEVSLFEQEYAEYIGTSHCVSCASGLDALWLIFRAYIELGLMKQGDEVIVPANTFIATVLAITENGLIPKFAEPNADSLQIDIDAVKSLLSAKTKAVCIVHLYGRCAYTDDIAEFCSSNSLLLIEDNAQAHGCKNGGARTGSLGDAAGHSFYPGKILGALGDGGAVTTNNKELACVIRSLANYGSEKKYYCKYKGRNSRLDEIQAAVLREKLQMLENDISARKSVAQYYINNINNPEIVVPGKNLTSDHVYHLFPILCKDRDRLQCYLSARGVESLIHYPIPPHKQECYKEYNAIHLPITEMLAKQELSLPISPVLTKDETYKVVECINSYK